MNKTLMCNSSSIISLSLGHLSYNHSYFQKDDQVIIHLCGYHNIHENLNPSKLNTHTVATFHTPNWGEPEQAPHWLVVEVYVRVSRCVRSANKKSKCEQQCSIREFCIIYLEL